MARLLGIMANRRDRLRSILHQERAIARPPEAPDAGWGIGFYQGDEVLHKKRPRTDTPVDWAEIARDVRSDCALLHVRLPTVGEFTANNTHPFRMRGWLFAQTGTLPRFSAFADEMRAALPDFLVRNIRGTTDSELFFHAILSFLHDSGQLGTLHSDPKKVVQAMNAAASLADRFCAQVGGSPAVLNCTLTNGHSMFAMRRGAPMVYVERRGLHDPPDDQGAAETEASSTLRYVMIASNVEDEATPSGYLAVDDGAIAVVDRDLRVSLH